MAEERCDDVIRRQRQRRRDDYENSVLFIPQKPKINNDKLSEETTENTRVTVEEHVENKHKTVAELVKKLSKSLENPAETEEENKKFESTDYTDNIIDTTTQKPDVKLDKEENGKAEDLDNKSKQRNSYENYILETDSDNPNPSLPHPVRGRKGFYENVTLDDRVRPPGVASDQEDEDTEESDTSTESEDYITDSDFSLSDFDDTEKHAERSSVSGMSVASNASTSSMRSYEIIRELARAEAAYVNKLTLLVRVFKTNISILNRVLENGLLPEDKVKVIFCNLDVIHDFHSTNLLPHIENRLISWSVCARIGDILKSCVPFFKLYLEFVENYKKACDLLTETCNKNNTFNMLVKEIENTAECRRLTLQQHFLSICQRPAFYQATLGDYIASLEDEPAEKQDIKECLDSLGLTINQLEKAMGREDRMKKLQEIDKKLSWTSSIVRSNRQYIKEGKIYVISPTSNKPKAQYLIVFNDVVLVCGLANITGKHKVKFELKVDGMQVEESPNISVAYTFHIKCRNKTVEFQAENREKLVEWMECLNGVLTEYNQWKLTGLPSGRIHKTNTESRELGERAPVLVHQNEASMCMACGSQFGIRRKKQHCMACGHVVCRKCCSWLFRLNFDRSKLSHVCDECYFTLSMQTLHIQKQQWNTLNVRADDKSVISTYLTVSSDRGRHWNKLWFSLRRGGILYSFSANKDIAALSSISITGCDVREVFKTDHVIKQHCFVIGGEKPLYFCCGSESTKERWMSALQSETKLSDQSVC